MSRQVQDIEVLMGALIGEHERLLRLIDAQQSAMKAMDLTLMEQARQQQESCRLRIATLETRRKALVTAMARGLGVPELTLARLAQLYPDRSAALLGARDRLHEIAGRIAERTHVVARLASAVLGHLNTAARLLSGAIEQAGVYTKSGLPRPAGRIGMMEAVG